MAVVLVTRPTLVAAPLIEVLQERGHSVVYEPLLSIETLDQPLPHLGEPFVAMITSQISAALLHERGMPEGLKHRACFCVGPQSAEETAKLGFTQVYAGNGDAGALAELVLKTTPADTHILHISSAYASQSGLPSLQESGRTVAHWPLYKAVGAKALSTSLIERLKSGDIDVLLFYSGQTARTFGELLRFHKISNVCENTTAIALSQTVADVLNSFGWQRIKIAAMPTQKAMIEALDQALPSKGK